MSDVIYKFFIGSYLWDTQKLGGPLSSLPMDDYQNLLTLSIEKGTIISIYIPFSLLNYYVSSSYTIVNYICEDPHVRVDSNNFVRTMSYNFFEGDEKRYKENLLYELYSFEVEKSTRAAFEAYIKIKEERKVNTNRFDLMDLE